MKWNRLVAAVGMLLSTMGCGSEQSHLAAGESGTPGTTIARLQKPDKEPASGGPITPVRATNIDAAETPKGDLTVRIMAQVNGVAILHSEVRNAVYADLVKSLEYPESERAVMQKKIIERGLQQLIEREVLLADMFARLKARPQALDKLKEAAGKEFDKQIRTMKANINKGGGKVATDEELKEFLATQGLSLDAMRRQRERDFMAMEYLRNLVWLVVDRIGHEQIQQYYEAHPEQFQIEDRVEWQDIFVDAASYPTREAARQAADQAAARARAGEDFKALAAELDKLGFDSRKGAGEGQRRGEIRPTEAEPMLFQMRDGDVGPVIELGTGFHVFRLVKRDHAGIVPFNEKTQAEIRRRIQMMVMERESKRVVIELKRKATIEYDTRP